MPKVSVIINCHNGEKFLATCLESIKNQTFTDYEVIFWDNCSNDRSAKIAQSFPGVKYYRGTEFVTLGKARNCALEKANGDYVSYIDCDDYWEPDKLKLQVAELDNNDRCGLVLTNYRRQNMLNNTSKDVYTNRLKKIVSFSDLVMNYHFCLSSFMFRKKALEGFDHYFNELFNYAEEFELFSRIAYKWDTIYIPEVLVTYRIHGAMNTMKLQDRKAAEYAMILESLRKMYGDIDKNEPEAMKWIEFNRDWNAAKTDFRNGNKLEARGLMKPYIRFNKRALIFVILSYFPNKVFTLLNRLYYANKY